MEKGLKIFLICCLLILCVPVSFAFTQLTGGVTIFRMIYTNVALTNITETFDDGLIITHGLTVSDLTGCDSIDTNSSGGFVCGTDDGGNPFDQILNTTSNVTFDNLNISGTGMFMGDLNKTELLGFGNVRIGSYSGATGWGTIILEAFFGSDISLWTIDNGGAGIRIYETTPSADQYARFRITNTTITLGEAYYGREIDLDITGDTIARGNLSVTGNCTCENVFLRSYIFAHTNKTIPVAVGGRWHNITFDEEASDPKRRITHTYNDGTNDTFTIVDSGDYEISYTTSYQDSAPAPAGHIVTRVVKNGAEIHGSSIECDTTKQASDKIVSHSLLVSLVANDEIILQFTSDDTTVSLTTDFTFGEHRDTSLLSIKRIG